MKRLAIILMVGMAVTLAVIDWVSYLVPVNLPLGTAGRRFAYVSFYDGLVRVYAYEANEPLAPTFSSSGTRIDFRRVEDRVMALRVSHAMSSRIRNNAWVDTRFRSAAPLTTVVRLRGVRLSLVLVVGGLVVVPIVTAVLEFMRRRRPVAGLCTGCLYDLTGNTSGTCPECGADVDAPVDAARGS